MIQPVITDYLKGLKKDKPEWTTILELEAQNDHVPIMDQISMDFLVQLLRIKNAKKILEIGTAIGYSALQMSQVSNEIQVVTVERDVNMFERALSNIEKLKKQKQIHPIFGDALKVQQEVEERAPYDLLFIDAAKGQYQKFFELYEPMLKEDGLIVTDNVLFRGLVADSTDASKRLQKLAEKIDQYNQWLIHHPDYVTTIVPIGDGVALSVPKRNIGV
ncbi:O-methyltransferase [Gracilibacillus dipsosauri]|uniref:O-methyltransferase n=1 Tax=Gracilibacillus dipsosauri TaxID=178340 RepID=UPI002409B271